MKKNAFLREMGCFFYKQIRRRREPPIQSFPCRTDRKGRFAGGGSHRFNHFHAELATGQIFSFLTVLMALRLLQGLDFAPQNLG